MPWFNVDDGLAFHHKVIKAGNAAMGLWVRAGSYCAQQLTDGFVAAEMVPSLGTVKQAQRLVSTGLWIAVDGGYRFHEWSVDGRNPTRAEVLARRSRNAERKAKQRAQGQPNSSAPQVNDGGHKGSHAGVTRESQGESATPLPSTPLPSKEGGHVAPESRCSEHITNPHPPPCNRCKEARLARERWDAVRAAAGQSAAAAVRACGLCDGDGFRYEPGRRIPLSPYERCDHRPLRSVS